MNPQAVGQFFENLEEVYAEKSYDTHHIFNVDETGLTTSPPPVEIIIKKDQCQEEKLVSADREQTITVCSLLKVLEVPTPADVHFSKSEH